MLPPRYLTGNIPINTELNIKTFDADGPSGKVSMIRDSTYLR